MQARLLPVLMVNFIGTLGFSIVLPFLVYLVEDFGGNAIVYGLIGATYPFFQMIGAPILGRWSDRFGRKRVLLLSQAGTLLSWVIFAGALALPVTSLISVDSPVLGAFAITLPLLVVGLARALDGVTGGNVSVANAYVADITTEDERGAAYGRMGASANLGFVAGPALASVLGATALGAQLPVWAALFVSLAATIVIAAWLPDVSSQELNTIPNRPSVGKVLGQEHKDCVELHGTTPGWGAMLARPRIAHILSLYFLIFVGFNLFYTAFPVHAVRELHWSVTETGIFFAFMSLMMVIVQGPVLSRVGRFASDATWICLGNVILAGAFLLLVRTDLVSLYVSAALFALGNGLMWPSVLSILSRVAGSQEQGAVQGIASSVGSLASIIGLVAGGFFYALAGTQTFIACAVLILASALGALPLQRRTFAQAP